MGVNKHRPHLFILPEDDANRQIARGFIEHRTIKRRCVQVRNPAGGWKKALKKFHSDYLDGMRRYRGRHLLFLIDFDQDKKGWIVSGEKSRRMWLIGFLFSEHGWNRRLSKQRQEKHLRTSDVILQQAALTAGASYGRMSCLPIMI